MSSILTGSIDRTSLSLSALTIGQGNGLSCYVGGVTIGRRTWRRTVEPGGRFVPGEYEVDAVLEQSRDPQFRFRARATTESALKTLIASLVAAVEQQTWAFTITVSGTAWPALTYTRADTDVMFDVPHVRGLTASVFVYTTRTPVLTDPI